MIKSHKKFKGPGGLRTKFTTHGYNFPQQKILFKRNETLDIIIGLQNTSYVIINASIKYSGKFRAEYSLVGEPADPKLLSAASFHHGLEPTDLV